MGNNTVTIRNNMIPEVQRRLRNISDAKMEVGFFEDGKGGKRHGKSKETVATVAMYHEFGTSKMPARPFMSAGSKKFSEDKRAVGRIVRLAIQGKFSGRTLALRMGKIYRLKIRAAIREQGFAPLSIDTVYRKGHDTQLRDTDQMYNSLENRVK